MGARLRAGIPAGDRAVDGLDEVRRHEIAGAQAVRHARRGGALRYAPRHPVPRRRAAEDGDQAQGLFGQLQIRPHRPLDALAAAVTSRRPGGSRSPHLWCVLRCWIPAYAGITVRSRDGTFSTIRTTFRRAGPVAQGIEHLPSKQRVEGSNPSGTANINNSLVYQISCQLPRKVTW